MACSTNVLIWTFALFNFGVNSCENKTVLCKYSLSEICDNALCECLWWNRGGEYVNTNITCDSVLFELPVEEVQKHREIQEIRLVGNNITTLQNGTFSRLYNATQLHLSNNKIKIIGASVFEFMDYLYYIDLSYNLIEVIGERAFNHLLNLTTLKLNYNRIKVIGDQAFSFLYSLEEISISFQWVSDIGHQAFSNLPSLKRLALDRNLITTIRSSSFENIPSLSSLFLTDNDISEIENDAFSTVSFTDGGNFMFNKLTVIRKGVFRDMPRGGMSFQMNRIRLIETRAFHNILLSSSIILANNGVKKIESYAFSDIVANSNSYTSIVFDDSSLQNIEQNAFYNVSTTRVILGIANDSAIEENFHKCNISNIYFSGRKDLFICNCTMMWISLWLQDGNNRNIIEDDLSCSRPTKKFIKNLSLDDFSYCREMAERYECNETKTVVLNCSFSFVSGAFVEWIHSRNGKHIRILKTLTSVLSIPFCSLEDIGDYTCVRTTRYTAVPLINTTTTLHVRGKPVVQNWESRKINADIILSVTVLSSDPVEIQWFTENFQLENDTDFIINTSIVPLMVLQYNIPVLVDGLETNLIIKNYNSLSTRAYTCRISNSIGSVEEVLVSRPNDIILPRHTQCHSSSRLEIDCAFNAVGAIPKYFIHTLNGKTIRQLTGTIVNNTYTLVIPFCSYQDVGDYTCVWDTDANGREFVNKTSTLTVNGPPIILKDKETVLEGFTILSVMFISHPYPAQPKWYLNGVAIEPSSDMQQSTSFAIVEIQLYMVTSYIYGFMSNLTMKAGREVFGDFKYVVNNEFGGSEKTITQKNATSESSVPTVDSRNDLLPIVIGSSASILGLVLIILVVVCVKRQQGEAKKSRIYLEATMHASNEENVYNTIQTSRITQEQDYIELS